MNFDRSKHTLEATRDFSRGPLSKRKGEALSKREIDRLDDDGVRNLVSVAGVAKPVDLDSESAKAADKAEAKAAEEATAAADTGDGVVDLPPVGGEGDGKGEKKPAGK